jgi:hypothetical protein
MIVQLNDFKNQLDHIEKNLVDKYGEIEVKKEKLEQMQEKVALLRSQKREDIIRINVGGKSFATTKETIMRVQDNLFYKLIKSNRFNFSKGIFLDRNPKMFQYILDYFRTETISLKNFTKEELEELKEEVLYYEVLPMEKLLDGVCGSGAVKYVNMEVSSYYYDHIGLVGHSTPDVLLDKDLTTGVCTNTNGWIILEFDKATTIDEISIGGYTGRTDWVYAGGYGSGGTIYSSMDKFNWTTLGLVPTGFGTTILKVTPMIKQNAKYLKIQHSSWLGIGYLSIN